MTTNDLALAVLPYLLIPYLLIAYGYGVFIKRHYARKRQQKEDRLLRRQQSAPVVRLLNDLRREQAIQPSPPAPAASPSATLWERLDD